MRKWWEILLRNSDYPIRCTIWYVSYLGGTIYRELLILILHAWYYMPNHNHSIIRTPPYNQGHIEPPKVARGHATFVDGKMLSVTKYRIQIYWYKHVTRRCAPLMRSLTAKWFFEMAGIPSAAFVFDDNLATKLTQKQTSNCCREWWMLHLHPAILSLNLACYTGRSGTQTSRSTCASWLRLDGVSILKSVALIFLAAIPWEYFLSNVCNHTLHAISCA